MLIANNFNQKTLFSLAIKLIVENMFPRPKMQFSVRNGYDNFPSHYLPFEVSVGVIFVAVMAVLFMGLFRSQFLQPGVLIVISLVSVFIK